MTAVLAPDPDALELAAALRDLLGRSADSAALRAAWDSADGRIPGLWKRLSEMGVTGLTVPEEYGGAGMDLAWAVPILVETGRAALPEPVVETLTGVALLSSAGGPLARQWLPRVADGSAVLAVGPSPTGLLLGADWADLLLLADDDGVRGVARGDAACTSAPSVDKGVRISSVQTRPPAGERLDGSDPAAAFDVAVVAVAAQLVGLAQAMLDMSVRYALAREQFGRPIGSFQAVKHALADVYVATSFALPVVHRAAWSVTRGLPSRARDASHAKHAAAVAARRAARTALQVHAGIGYTYEHDLHMWLKRTWTLASMWGDEEFHRHRVAAAVLSDAPPPRVP